MASKEERRAAHRQRTLRRIVKDEENTKLRAENAKLQEVLSEIDETMEAEHAAFLERRGYRYISVADSVRAFNRTPKQIMHMVDELETKYRDYDPEPEWEEGGRVKTKLLTDNLQILTMTGYLGWHAGETFKLQQQNSMSTDKQE